MDRGGTGMVVASVERRNAPGWFVEDVVFVPAQNARKETGVTSSGAA